MADSKTVHPAAEALSVEMDNWEQFPADSRWCFTTIDGVLTAQELDYDGSVLTTYGVDLADIRFTKIKES